MRKRIKNKYCNYWGWKVRKSDLPKTCFNVGCPYHNEVLEDDCKYKKCRLKACGPTIENNFNEDKRDSIELNVDKFLKSRKKLKGGKSE